MKVLLVSPLYAPGPGGSARLLRDFVDHLNEGGGECDVLTFAYPPWEANAAFDRAQPYRVDRVRPVRVPGGGSALTALALIRLLACRRPDVVVCGVANPTAILVAALKRVFRVPFVVYSHGEDVTGVTDQHQRRALARALHRSSAVMVNSRFTGRAVTDLGIPDELVHWVPPGIDPAPYEHPDASAVAALRDRWRLAGKRVILTLARLVERKGHDTVVRALPGIASEFPDAHYLVVGLGDQRPLHELAASAGVADRVTIVEGVTDEELPSLYALADVYVMVSRTDPASRHVEGFGICYLEAGAAGKPAIAGSEGGAPDAVEHGVTGLVVDPTDVSAVADAVRRLLRDSEAAEAMGRAAQRRVRERFTRDGMLAAAERIIQDAARPRTNMPPARVAERAQPERAE